MDIAEIYLGMPALVRAAGLSTYGWYQARKRFGGTFHKRYLELLESQWLDPAKLRQWQLERVVAMLWHAYDKVPFYRRSFDEAGVNPAQVSNLSDLRRFPFLTRHDVAIHLNTLTSSDAHTYRPILWKSSGSTGQKLQFYLPEELKWAFSSAVLWRYYQWGGVELGEPRATMGARVFTRNAPFWMWNRWENQLLLSAHHTDTHTMAEYIEAIKRFKVTFIQGHPSAVSVLADFLISRGDTLPLKAVFTTGETVFEEDRQVMETAFQCPVLDSYGMGEAVAAAQQCKCGKGYHEISEYGLLELEPVGDGMHEVIGTSLHNFAMPFIRYRTGDLVKEMQLPEVCSCGKSLPLRFERVIGRIDDRLHLPGKTVLPVTVRMFMKPRLQPGENYQMIQEAPNEVRLLLTGSVSADRRQTIMRDLRSIIPPGVSLYVEHADRIHGTNNKVRNVISRVK